MKIKIPYCKVGVADFSKGVTDERIFYCWKDKLSKQNIAERVNFVPFQVLKKGTVMLEIGIDDFTTEFKNQILDAINADNQEV